MLNLKRPIAFFDLETTGVNVASDRIVELAIIKVMPDGTVQRRPESPGKENRYLINPTIPIPVESSLVHGIYDDDVKEAPTFKQISKGLFKFLLDCDLAGFNSNKFDVPLLAEEFLRVGINFSMEGRNLIDVQTIYHIMEQRTLKAAYKFYCNEDLSDAHEAMPDTQATLDVFEAMLTKYDGAEVIDAKGNQLPTFENDMDVLHRFCQRGNNADLMGRLVYDENGEVLFNFGKYKGQQVKAVLAQDPGYYGWMMNGDFPLYTKQVLTDVRNDMRSNG
ncbi:MAG: 3'-5' exonuclease [Flavobacteriales bacterium]|nr:3'-5' exonuclease [Flavobacteriales bacterium]